MLNQQSLFGGALSISIPDVFVNASNFREIPDNQEVFVSKDSDFSFIIELLETPENLDIR